MIIVFFIVVVDLLGFGIVLPILPVTGDEYLEPIFHGDTNKAVRGAMVGLLMASFSAMQFLFAPSWGRLSDRIGRRPVLLIGLVGSVIFYGLFGNAAGLPLKDADGGESAYLAGLALTLMFVARIGAGVSGATIATAQAVIADCTAPEKRKHGMALIGAAFGIAFTVGPLLGALAMSLTSGQSATSYTGYLAAALSLIALLMAVFLLPETRNQRGAVATERQIFNVAAWRNVLRNAAVAPVVFMLFLSTLGFGGFESTLALLIKYVLDIDKNRAYWLFAYVGLVLLLSQGFLYRRLAKKLSEVVLMTAGIILMAIGTVSLAGVNLLRSTDMVGWWLLFLAMLPALATAVIGFSFLQPSAQALVSRRTPADRQGEVLGVNQSASALARILGPIVGLTLFKITETHMLPYLFGGGLLVLMLPLIPRVKRG